MDILIKFIIIALSGWLWRLGGTYKKTWCRDVLLPILFGTYLGLFTWNVYLGLLSVASFMIVRIGYGAYDPINDDKPSFLGKLTKDKEGWIIRSIVGFLYIFSGLMPFYVYGAMYSLGYDLSVYFGGAMFVAFVSGVLCKLKAKDYIIEPAIGAAVALIVMSIK